MPMNQTDYKETALSGAPYFLPVSHLRKAAKRVL